MSGRLRTCRNCGADAPGVWITVEDLALRLFVCSTCLPEALLSVGQELQPLIVEDTILSVWCEPIRETTDRYFV